MKIIRLLIQFTFSACLISTTSCVYKSAVISTKIKNSRISSSGSIFSQDSIPPTILNEPISLEMLKEYDAYKTDGSFQIYLSNESTFIKAEAFSTNGDSITLKGVITNKEKKDTTILSITYPNTENNFGITNIGTDAYLARLQLSQDSLKSNSPQDINFILSKTQNFIITPNSLELLTGEIVTPNGSTFKYLIINDPDKISRCLKSVCIITIVSKEAIKKECSQKFSSLCSNGFNVDIRYGLSFYKDIHCECIQKQ